MKLSAATPLVGLVCLLACVELAHANPMANVLEMMKQLAGKIEADGAKEADDYRKFMDWCDEACANKKFGVDAASKQVAELEAKVNQAASTIEVATEKIGQLASSIAKAADKLSKAEPLRKRENAAFMTSEKELMEMTETLGAAEKTIEKSMEENGATALAQVNTTNMANMVQAFGSVLAGASVSTLDRDKLLAYLQSNAEEGEDAEDDDAAQLGAPKEAVYTAKSGGITEVLADLKEDSLRQLSKLRRGETEAQNTFKLLKQALGNELAASKKEMADQKALKSKAAEEKSKAAGELEVKSKDLAASKAELKTVQSSCLEQAGDHQKTVEARNEELGVLAKAREALQKKSQGGASFLQISAAAGSPKSRVLAAVRRLAREHHSAALAQLATHIESVVRRGRQRGASSGGGPLDSVKKLVSDMINKLERQASEEANEKEYCDREMQKTASKEEDLADDVAEMKAKMDKAASKEARLKDEVRDLQGDTAALAKEQADLDRVRAEEKADYEKSKADLVQGLDGLRTALNALRDYYGNSAAASMMQEDSDFEAFMQQPAAPEKHSKASGAGANVISILETIEAKLSDNLSRVETQEADAQSDYEAVTARNKMTEERKAADMKKDSRGIKRLDNRFADTTSDKETASSELSAVRDYEAQLKKRCIAKPVPFEERAKKREAEVDGLKEALAVLKEDAASLLQRSRSRIALRGAAALDATDDAS